MALIRPNEMKILLLKYSIIKTARDSLELNLMRMADDNSGDDIYAACMQANIGGGIPTIGNVSDKTANIAVTHAHSQREDIKQLQRDVNLLKDLIGKIDMGMNAITKAQRSIISIRLMAGEEVKWKDVVSELNKQEYFYCESQVRKINKYGIECLIEAAQITVEMYNEAIDIMEGRGG